MKCLIIIMFCAAAIFSAPQTVTAGPVTFAVNKASNIVHRAAYRVNRHVIEPTNRHVIQPARRTIVNHTPPR